VTDWSQNAKAAPWSVIATGGKPTPAEAVMQSAVVQRLVKALGGRVEIVQPSAVDPHPPSALRVVDP
jgi:hypothetical protein